MKVKSRILMIAGTRPNFIKLAPLYHRLIGGSSYDIKICHTGQHFDYDMSDVFWSALSLPVPDYSLHVHGGSASDIIGRTISALSDIFNSEKFDLVIVFGDVNATIAGAITAAHFQVKVMHVESGLRSFDKSMPEEINRIVTDHVSDYLMVSEESGLKNLQNEGINESKIFFVGNIMIESLIMTRKKWESIILPIEKYVKPLVLATFHRPENVDVPDKLFKIVQLIESLSDEYNVIFPVHPRTRKNLLDNNLLDRIEKNESVFVQKPLEYFHFLKTMSLSKMVITDSGGVQEETSFLNIPCFTFRRNTERPITLTIGTNRLMNLEDNNCLDSLYRQQMFNDIISQPNIPMWDDQVSSRITKVVHRILFEL